MSRVLIEKAREQRLKALCHAQQKSIPAGMQCAFDILNVFDISGESSAVDNVIAFRNHPIHAKTAVQGNRHFH